MAFLYAFAAPRSKPVQFESLAHTNAAASLLNAAVSFFSSKPAAPAAATGADGAAAAAGANSTAGASSSAAAAASPADLTKQIVPNSPPHNLSLASQARARVLVALLTPASVDREVDLTRIAALKAYLPFIRTIYEQYSEITDESEKTRIAKAPGSLQWSSVLQVGARPVENKKKGSAAAAAAGGDNTIVPFWDYESFHIGEELAHAYFTLGIALYQRAGSLTFHATQLANTIPPCNFLCILPWYNKECNASIVNGTDGSAAAAASAPPARRMFNPLSFVAPPPSAAASASSTPGPSPPKSASEVSAIRSQIISKRREAVECLRTASGLFSHLSQQFLPSIFPVPQRRMLDTMPAISEALGKLCLVHCQQHTLLSALVQLSETQSDDSSSRSRTASLTPAQASPVKSPLSPSVMSKLLQGLIDQLTEVKSILQQKTGSYYAALEPSLHAFLRVSLERARCDRLTVLALQAENASEHGRALSLLCGAIARLTLLASNDSSRGLPLAKIRDCNPVLSEMKQNTLLQLAQITRVRDRLGKENEKIYFENVPELAKALEEAGDPPAGAQGEDAKPAGAFLPTPLHYELPPLLPALFLATPKASSWTDPSAAAALAERGRGPSA